MVRNMLVCPFLLARSCIDDTAEGNSSRFAVAAPRMNLFTLNYLCDGVLRFVALNNDTTTRFTLRSSADSVTVFKESVPESLNEAPRRSCIVWRSQMESGR